MTICDKCGHEIALGEWAFCPHGEYRGTNLTDEIPGGITLENLGHEPMTFYSKSEILKEADKRGLQPMVRHVEGDQFVSSWACMDPYTLAAATALVSRRAKAVSDPGDDIPCETAKIEVKAL